MHFQTSQGSYGAPTNAHDASQARAFRSSGSGSDGWPWQTLPSITYIPWNMARIACMYVYAYRRMHKHKLGESTSCTYSNIIGLALPGFLGFRVIYIRMSEPRISIMNVQKSKSARFGQKRSFCQETLEWYVSDPLTPKNAQSIQRTKEQK